MRGQATPQMSDHVNFREAILTQKGKSTMDIRKSLFHPYVK